MASCQSSVCPLPVETILVGDRSTQPDGPPAFGLSSVRNEMFIASDAFRILSPFMGGRTFRSLRSFGVSTGNCSYKHFAATQLGALCFKALGLAALTRLIKT